MYIFPEQKVVIKLYNSQLETFIKVADAGSFNKAAEESYITPTAVIKQVNLLEDSLGVKLFERSHRGLTLTKAGRSLYQDAKYIIRYCRDSVTRAKNAMQEDNCIIRIGSSPMTPAQLISSYNISYFKSDGFNGGDKLFIGQLALEAYNSFTLFKINFCCRTVNAVYCSCDVPAAAFTSHTVDLNGQFSDRFVQLFIF